MPYSGSSITLPAPGIITLMPYTRELVRQGAELGVCCKYSGLFPAADTDPLESIYLDHLIRSGARAQIERLAYANNLLLATAQVGVEPQRKLAALFLSDSVREAVSNYISEEGPYRPRNHLIFHSWALLLNMKLLLGIREELLQGSEENTLPGTLTLLAND